MDPLWALECLFVGEEELAHPDWLIGFLEHLAFEGVRCGFGELDMPAGQVGVSVLAVLAQKDMPVLDQDASRDDFGGGGLWHGLMIFSLCPDCALICDAGDRVFRCKEAGMGSTEKGITKKTKRARLGRGLSALVDAAPIKVDPSLDVVQSGGETISPPANPNNLQTNNQYVAKDRVIEVALDRVSVNPNQPRRVFESQALESLAASIRAHGLMQPIVVRAGEGAGAYELIAGERRLRAAKLAGMTTIRAIVDEADDERSAELALIENMQREDLNPIERALGLRQLMDRFGSTQQELSDRMGMSRPGLANLLRLLDLGDDVRALVASGVLSVGHAKVLLSCHDENQRSTLAHEAIEQGWTVRALEHAIASAGSVDAVPPDIAREGEQGANSIMHPDRVGSVLRDLERSLSEHLGTKVTLKTNKQGTQGRVQIEFYDLDQFDGLLAKLGVQGERV